MLKSAKFSGQQFDTPYECQRVAQNYAKIYNYNVAQVIQAFKNLSLIVDGSAANSVEIMAKLIKIKLNLGCQKPLRMVVSAEPSHGLTEFKQKMCAMFGIVLIDLPNLIVSHLKNKTLSGQIIAQAKAANEQIPESTITDIIHDRIEKIDCRLNGFLLDVGSYGLSCLKNAAEQNMTFNVLIDFSNAPNRTLSEEFKSRLKIDKCLQFKPEETADDCSHKVFFEVSHFYD